MSRRGGGAVLAGAASRKDGEGSGTRKKGSRQEEVFIGFLALTADDAILEL
jgi:hypothetical protein